MLLKEILNIFKTTASKKLIKSRTRETNANGKAK